MENFNWNEFIQGNIAVHCNTEEKANDFLKECCDRGMVWYKDFSYIQSLKHTNKWIYFQNETCYFIKKSSVHYFSLKNEKSKNYKIIEWEIE